MRGARRIAAAGLVAVLAVVSVAGCTSTPELTPSTGMATSSDAVRPTSSALITPVTPNGLLTGPGVTATTVALGVLVDPDRDRGFTDGVRLWQQVVNSTGGVCGRTVTLATNGTGGVPADPAQAYPVIGRQVLGLVALGPADPGTSWLDDAAADQIPTVVPSGADAQLGPDRPVVVGATAGVQLINTLAYLAAQGTLPDGGRLGVVGDGSPESDDALAGLRWWAADHDVDVMVRASDEPLDGAIWTGVPVVVSLAGPQPTGQVLETVPADTMVITGVDGYRPDVWSEAARAAVDRVVVMTPVPAYGSDQPRAADVMAWYQAAGGTAPGARLLSGFGTAQVWGRMLLDMCEDADLTRSAAWRAVATMGPAPSDSLFGAVELSRVLGGRPATVVSALARGDLDAPAQLTPLTWLGAAEDVERYLTQR
ncbi:ABC transporter substrate-binding protein [Nakamurella leprariae]|uniref:ABC transporter substrate-binding protein n=1 Tax=Nakamurella leprariae TaxID=2803911 RepID=A0A938YE12_9ACTN|nr:ABC transporter substrate-binding protein [Nakamurella leprariae]MBM9466454.1 ABC transporter substrate-binding protein [Nakamurella leprariae]